MPPKNENETNPTSDVTNAEILSQVKLVLYRLDDLEDQVTDLSHTVRGVNGTPGLVTEVALIRQQLAGLSPGVDKDKDPKSKSDTALMWAMDKLVVPAVTAIILWLLFQAIPHVANAANAVTK